ncbi:MAG: hypothetical protein QGG25_12695 [Phycisphaerae bacterium]|nr:hypothetical protein [Phycisphaerae bacterium]
MALGFFRRWQKGIIITMVALMLVGLVGGTALRYFSRYTGRGDFKRGESRFGDVTHGAIGLAEADLRDLATFLQLDRRSNEFARISGNAEDSSMAYALLLQEAAAAGHDVGQAEIDSYLKDIGLEVGQAEYRKVISRVDRRKSGTTEPKLRTSLARWLMVLRSFRAYQVASPPSETALKKLFRDLNEKLTLRILKIPAEKYAADVLAPVDSQIKQQFAKYRTARPNVYPTAESFGFGYAQPARVAVEYMVIDSGVIARISRPADRAVRDYFRSNSAEFTKDVPVVPQPAPLPGATTKPAVVTKKVPMEIDEAWGQVVDRLMGWAAESKTEDFVQFVQTKVDARLDKVSADAELHQNIYNALIDKDRADAALSKMVDAKAVLALRGKTLDPAMPALAKAAGLSAICYPWETEGEFSVSKDVRIPDSLQADGPRTLNAVLEEITRLVFTTGKESLEAVPTGAASATTKPKPAQYPKLKWTACGGLSGVLFPVGSDKGMTLLPVRVGRTELLDGREISEHKDLGTAQSSRRGRGKSLAADAMGAKTLSSGRVMYTFSAGGLNRILWQLTESKAAEILTQPNDKVLKDVAADCKLLESYKNAASRVADKIAARARTIGLEAAAKEADMETVSTEPVSRLTSQSQRDMIRQTLLRQAIMGGIPEGVSIQDYMAQIQAYGDRLAMNYRPHDYMSSMVQGVELKTPKAAKRFLERAFELAPADVDKPLPAGVGPIVTIPMPTAKAHYIVQRIGYMPAVVGDFEQIARGELAQEALANAQWEARMGFFSYPKIVARVGFTDGNSAEGSDEK